MIKFFLIYFGIDQAIFGQRSKKFGIYNNLKPFRYLINLAISLAEDMSKKLGLRYIVLSPDSDNLKEKYLSVGFKKLNKDWMFFKI